MVKARNTISGQIADVSPKILQHPKFKDILEVVEEESKPYVPELYKPGTKEEKKSARKSKQEETVEVESGVEEFAVETIEIEED